MRVERIGDATLYLGDCREVLPTLGGGFGAVVTDPPYGIGEAAGKSRSRSNAVRARDYGDDPWDDAPISAELMATVRAAGRWAVIFGGNYYALPASSCWLVWDKMTTGDFADCELAWTNLPKAVRRIRYLWNGMARAKREPRGDHPTQKPLGVMRWALDHLPGDVTSVIDPFMGSGTTGVACIERKLRFVGIEREERYFDAACRRIAAAVEEAMRSPGLGLSVERPPAAVQPSIFGGDE